MEKIILASNSPRRKELLTRENIPFEVIASDVAEVTSETSPEKVVMALSLLKAKATFDSLEEKATVLAADTIVTLDEKILGKPKDKDDALNMLKSLSGRTHKVYTGVSIIRKDGSKESFFDCTEVEMFDNSEETLLSYISTGEPMDKAGSYGIQGLGGKLVKEIHGDFDNVVGLPVKMVKERLTN